MTQSAPDIFDQASASQPDAFDVSPVKFVMCPPQYLSTRIPNNVFMKNEAVDVPRAMRQWTRTLKIIQAFDVDVLTIPPVPNCQDQTYVANIGIALKPFIVLANYKAEGRACEVPPAKAFFEKLGYPTIQPPYYFEGEADLKKLRDGVYIGGYGKFSAYLSLQWIAEKTGVQIVPVQEISDELYHLDCSLMVMDEENILVTREGLAPDSVKKLEKLAKITYTPADIASTGITNGVLIPEKRIYLSGTFNPEQKDYVKAMEWLLATMDRFDYRVVLCDVDEYNKSGADLSCTIFHLDF